MVMVEREGMRGYVSFGLGGGYSLLSANVALAATGERNTGGLARMSVSTVCRRRGLLDARRARRRARRRRGRRRR